MQMVTHRSKLVSLLLAVILVASSFACSGTAGNTPPTVTPNIHAAIDIARGVARSGGEVYLQTKGVPVAVSAAVFAAVDPTIDAWLNTGNFNIVLDEAQWIPYRQGLVDQAAAALSKAAKVNGVSILDDATAKILCGQLIDAIASAIKSTNSSHAAPAS